MECVAPSQCHFCFNSLLNLPQSLNLRPYPHPDDSRKTGNRTGGC